MKRLAFALAFLALALAAGLLGFGIARLMPPKDPLAGFHATLGPPRRFLTYGPGVDSCEKMLSNVADGGDTAKIVYLSWVLGYLTAAGVFPIPELRGLRQYCRLRILNRHSPDKAPNEPKLT